MAGAAQVEVWESTVPGRVSMRIAGPRGTERPVSVVGKGSRLRISTEDRELVEEQIRYEQYNPFINGKLRHVGGPKRVPREDEVMEGQELGDEDLSALFALSPEDFGAALDELSEVNVRRIRDLFVQNGGTVAQLDVLQEYTETKWPSTSGDTATWREMRAETTPA